MPAHSSKDLNSFTSDIKTIVIPSTYVIPRLLYKFVWCTGLTSHGSNGYQKVTSTIFSIMMYVVIIDIHVTHIEKGTEVYLIKMIAVYLMSCILPAVTYHVMRRRRKQINLLLQNLKQLSKKISKCQGDWMVLLICFMPILFSVSVTAAFVITSDRPIDYTYGIELRSNVSKVLVLGPKFFLYFLLHPTLNNMLALLYCTLCMRCSDLIRNLKEEVAQCPLEKFKACKQMHILLQKEKIDTTLGNIEEVFSLPSFLIITTNILSCSSILGSTLIHKNLKYPLLIQWILYATNIFGCLLMTFWVAGSIPVELKKFKDTFYKKACLSMLKAGNPEEPRLERWIFDKPDFVLTGCGIFSYTRNSLLAVLGGLLTYTVLVVDKENHPV